MNSGKIDLVEPADVHPDLASQEAYWDWWQDVNSTNDWALRRGDVLLSIIRAHVRAANPHILDFGCGNGWFSLRLAELGHVTALDLSRKNMEIAKARFPHINFIAGDVHAYPLPSAHYDLLVSQQVVAHVTDPKVYVRRAAELLKPGGHFLVSTNNRFVIDRWSGFESHRARGHLEHWMSMQDLTSLLSNHFRIVFKQSFNPIGDRGILRFTNSAKLNAIASLLLSKQTIQTLKERAGLGYINIVLAQKPA
jgi:2-polyprenyl-3-methyl-5-hydroxy-6-metoxy-1,4-benzoquinol methylase